MPRPQGEIESLDVDFTVYHGSSAWLEIVRVYNFMESRISSDLRDDELTLAQFDVMVTLSRAGCMSQQELADRLLVTKGNIVGLIDRLSARGFVERQPSETDRRVNLLQITPDGRRKVEQILPRQMKLIATLMMPLERREADALEGLLGRLKS